MLDPSPIKPDAEKENNQKGTNHGKQESHRGRLGARQGPPRGRLPRARQEAHGSGVRPQRPNQRRRGGDSHEPGGPAERDHGGQPAVPGRAVAIRVPFGAGGGRHPGHAVASVSGIYQTGEEKHETRVGIHADLFQYIGALSFARIRLWRRR